MIKIISLVLIIFNSQFSFFVFKEHLNYVNIIPKDYHFVDDKIMLESIFKQKIKIIKRFENGVSKEKPVLFEVNERKFVFKILSENQRDADYFVTINDYMSQSLLPIHKLFLVENFEKGTYGVFEYFEDFITAPFKNYYKVGRMLAITDNTMRKFKFSYSPRFETKVEIFNRALRHQKPRAYTQILEDLILNIKLNSFYFEKLHGHYDFNFGNVDLKFRIIDIGNAHYGWRIDNFLNILFVNSAESSVKGEDALLQAISGYNSVADKPLNYFEIMGIIDIIIGYHIRSRILQKPDNLLKTNFVLLNKLKIAI